MAESSSTVPTRNFTFVLHSPSVLKNAVEALSDPTFNPMQRAMIQVGEDGFDITVNFIDKETKNQIFGYLHFKATGLQDFQFNMPLQKMVSLKLIYRVLKDASDNDHRGIMIYSVSGSKKLFFYWGGADPGQEKIPTVINYGFEAVIPSDILKGAFTELLQLRRKPTSATARFVLPRVNIILNNEIILSTEEEAERHEVLFGWNYWESLQKATSLADKCWMYLIRDPPQLSAYVMLRFKLLELGDLIYLIPAQFLTDKTRSQWPSASRFFPSTPHLPFTHDSQVFQ